MEVTLAVLAVLAVLATAAGQEEDSEVGQAALVGLLRVSVVWEAQSPLVWEAQAPAQRVASCRSLASTSGRR